MFLVVMFLGEMLHSHLLLSLECVCVCVCPYMFMPSWWIRGKQLEINLQCFYPLVGHTKAIQELFGNIVAHDLDLLLEDQRFELR